MRTIKFRFLTKPRKETYFMYQKIMHLVLISLKESNYLRRHTADFLLKFCDGNSEKSSLTESDFKKLKEMSEAIIVSDTAEKVNKFNLSKIPLLLRLFPLIFEIKFIFGDIDFKF
ncbi:hypothetical protein RF11_01251 [Thelohanellus kitauei]|uniref:Uncharacterized protein n=1 Tax=Thelohanellus kitauei TaxID=669202 RepID=A0A0C2JAR3_THEKT|nr:hypothetical protein RF11_01251 [Thelohanellus kitauei]